MGYAFIQSSTVYFSAATRRGTVWQRVGLLLEMLAAGQCSPVIWMDGDAMFLPHSRPLLTRLVDEMSQDVIFSFRNRNYSTQVHCTWYGILLVPVRYHTCKHEARALE